MSHAPAVPPEHPRVVRLELMSILSTFYGCWFIASQSVHAESNSAWWPLATTLHAQNAAHLYFPALSWSIRIATAVVQLVLWLHHDEHQPVRLSPLSRAVCSIAAAAGGGAVLHMFADVALHVLAANPNTEPHMLTGYLMCAFCGLVCVAWLVLTNPMRATTPTFLLVSCAAWFALVWVARTRGTTTP